MAESVPTPARAGGRRPTAPQRTQLLVLAEVAAGGPRDAPTLLAARSGLSKVRVKEAMSKGAVWLQRAGRRPQRLRRASAELVPGDRLTLHYDSWLLDLTPPAASLCEDRQRYSLWLKPAGLLVEGSRFGDHATLVHQVERHFGGRREVLLVHRLDLEAEGLMVLAHGRSAAARLSALFRDRLVEKDYLVEVRGRLGEPGTRGGVDRPLDGKPARTDYLVELWDAGRGVTRLRVSMRSGRYHQIRRHLDGLGHPVMGDPRYGQGNADPRGLRLAAVRLAFADPWSGEALAWSWEGLSP